MKRKRLQPETCRRPAGSATPPAVSHPCGTFAGSGGLSFRGGEAEPGTHKHRRSRWDVSIVRADIVGVYGFRALAFGEPRNDSRTFV